MCSLVVPIQGTISGKYIFSDVKQFMCSEMQYTHIDCDLTDETELVLHRDEILSGGFLCHHAQSYLGFAFALCCVVL